MPISRRVFLANSARAAVGVGAALLFEPRLRSEPLGLPAGIQLFAVREPLAIDTPGTFRQLHEIGFREVETAGFGKYTAQQFGQMIRDAGLRCPSAHLPFAGATDLGAIFSDCHALGATFATSSSLRQRPPVAAPGPRPPAANPPVLPSLGEDGFKRMAVRMNEIGAAAKAAGLQYCYHNGTLEFERMPDNSFGYDLLLAETDPELVCFEADCGWIVEAGGDLNRYFTAYPKRFRLLHVKDFKPKPAQPTPSGGTQRPEGTEMGRGSLDQNAIFSAARHAAVEHIFEEQEQPYERPQLESARISYEYLRTLK